MSDDTPTTTTTTTTTKMDVVVVGAGLSGLCAADHILRALPDVSLTVLEARDRVGGRTHNVLDDVPLDVGGAWSWRRSFPHLSALVDRLGVEAFPQPGKGLADVHDVGGGRVMRTANDPQGRYRFKGGAAAVAHVLRDRVTRAGGVVRVGARVTTIDQSTDGACVVSVEGASHGSGGGSVAVGAGAELDSGDTAATTISAAAVVVAVPPRVASRTITFLPGLPPARAAAMADCPTWMSLTGKVVVLYAAPFWTEDGLSGEGFSRVGPVSQWYDASDGGDDDAKRVFALCGFLFGEPAVEYATRPATRARLEAGVIDQLKRMFGPKAGSPLALHVKSWAGDRETTGEVGTPTVSSHLMSHPAENPALRPPTGRIAWAGSETAGANAGLLDGAVAAGQRAGTDVVDMLRPDRAKAT